jgi:hypothetical protein
MSPDESRHVLSKSEVSLLQLINTAAATKRHNINNNRFVALTLSLANTDLFLNIIFSFVFNPLSST